MALSLHKINADIIGVWASSLCAIHCAVTPLLFAAQVSVHFGQHAVGEPVLPWYWGVLDWAFLVLAFIAILFTSRQVAAAWVKWGMWAAWSLIAAVIISETFHLHLLGHAFMYVGAFILIGLHWYNHRQCRLCEVESATDES